MATPTILPSLGPVMADLRRQSHGTLSRKTDMMSDSQANFGNAIEEQKAERKAPSMPPAIELRGRVSHDGTNSFAEEALLQSSTTHKHQGAEYRGLLTKAPSLSANVALASQQSNTTQSAALPSGQPQSHKDNNNIHDIRTSLSHMADALLGQSDTRNLGQLINRASLAVRSVVTGDLAPKAIALNRSQSKGIALDASTQQLLQRAYANKLPDAPPSQKKEVESSANKLENNVQQPAQKTTSLPLGELAAQFESGTEGIAAIGYDRNGGTSYGKYQIASRPGSMEQFISFLEQEAPDMAQKLANAGPANTGSRKGAMPNAWRELAAEDPERFERLQEQFIHNSHYLPAHESLSKQGFSLDSLSRAMQEVLFSTAVQHGPDSASRIFSRAAKNVGLTADGQKEQELINEIYSIRAEQFGSSSKQIQVAVRQRMAQEQELAMNMSRQYSA